VIYVYGITDATEPPDRRGLRDARLSVIRESGLGAVVSVHESLELEAEEDELWAHEAVVEALMERGPVLPMRIGSVAADPVAVVSLLRERSAEFRRALERVRGAVEVGVRAAPRNPSAEKAQAPALAGAAGPGTEYMLARLSEKTRDDEAAAQIHAALRPLARSHTSPTGSAGSGPARAAYLVDRERVDEFAGRVDELQRDLDWSIVCTGPWPPYSFTEEPG